MNNHPFTFKQKAAAWGVHLFTASGMVAGFFSIVAISERNFSLAFTFLFLTLIIDGLDGTLARMCHVQEVLPYMSGKTMDYVIDFATYAIIPAYLLYSATYQGLPAEFGGVYIIPESLRTLTVSVILLISTLYYGKDGMVSDDLYFVGFPVMWNFVAFYLFYVFEWPPIVNFVAIMFFAVMHFVPIKYIYPSRTVHFQALNLLFSLFFIASNFALMLMLEWYPQYTTWVLVARILSVISVGYFGFMSVFLIFKEPKKNAVELRGEESQ